jgi:hypothetical protein
MTDRERLWRNRFAYSVGFILILGVVILFLIRSQGSNSEAFHRDREANQVRETHLIQQNKALDDLRKAERRLRWGIDSLYHIEKKSRLMARNELIRRERRTRPDTIRKTLVDTVYQVYDSAILASESHRKADSTSFEREIRILGQKNLKLDSANTAKFHKLDSAYVKLIDLSGKVDNRTRSMWISIALNVFLALILIL